MVNSYGHVLLGSALLGSVDGENDRRKDFMINFHESMWLDLVLNSVPLTPQSDAQSTAPS